MAELADALDLGSSVARRAGSSPVNRIFFSDPAAPSAADFNFIFHIDRKCL
jgi:hypothetical protein